VTDEPTRTPRKPRKPAANAAPAKRAATKAAGTKAAAAKAAPARAPRKTPKAEGPALAPTPAETDGAAPTRKAGRSASLRPEPSGLRLRYRDDVVPALVREFGYANPMQVPRVEKVVVNIGLGEAIQNAKAIDAAVGDLAIITGQKPIVTRATRSIAQFRLRTGMPVGAKVTLRGQRMYDFLERTMRLALPRIRDFRGVSPRSFDGRGNFSLGLREQLMFPEIDYDKIDRLRGLEISIVTSARTDEEGRRLLALLGMPFSAT
jgi:large subunit ribosomal protein L5